MPVLRKWVAQNTDESQILRVGFARRFIVVTGDDWQPLFNSKSFLTKAVRVLKLAAEFNAVEMNTVRIAAYLFNVTGGGVDNPTSCVFNLFSVSRPNWKELPLLTVNGVLLPNQYFFADVDAELLNSVLDGSTTLMIEAHLQRMAESYRDRIYVNHLGSYDTLTRLRQDVEFLDLSKLDE